MSGHIEIVEKLLKSGANAEAIDHKLGQSPLQFAAWAGKTLVVQLLLKTGSAADRTLNETTALAPVSTFRHYETTLELLKYGADPNIRDVHRRHTPLSIAAAGGHPAVVRLPLEYGADVNQMEPITKLSALYHAKVLIAAGAQIHGSGNEG